MAYEPLLDRLLTDAIGDGPDVSPALIAELRASLLASATGHVAALSRADDPAIWREEAYRLQGLAASFGLGELMRAAKRAGDGPPDPDRLDAVAEALAALR